MFDYYRPTIIIGILSAVYREENCFGHKNYTDLSRGGFISPIVAVQLNQSCNRGPGLPIAVEKRLANYDIIFVNV